jgi:hypothetical protein
MKTYYVAVSRTYNTPGRFWFSQNIKWNRINCLKIEASSKDSARAIASEKDRTELVNQEPKAFNISATRTFSLEA